MTTTRTLETLAFIRNATTAFLFGVLYLLTQTYHVHAATNDDAALAVMEAQTDAIGVVLDGLSSGQVLGEMTGPTSGGAPNTQPPISGGGGSSAGSGQPVPPRPPLNTSMGGGGPNGSSTSSARPGMPMMIQYMQEHASGMQGSSTLPQKPRMGTTTLNQWRMKMLENKITLLSKRLLELTQQRAKALAELAKLQGVDVSTLPTDFTGSSTPRMMRPLGGQTHDMKGGFGVGTTTGTTTKPSPVGL